MIRIAPSSAISTPSITPPAGARRGLFMGLLTRLLNTDRKHREMRELERIGADVLYDIGVNPEDFDSSFRSRFGRNRQTSETPDYHGRYPS